MNEKQIKLGVFIGAVSLLCIAAYDYFIDKTDEQLSEVIRYIEERDKLKFPTKYGDSDFRSVNFDLKKAIAGAFADDNNTEGAES